MSRLVGLALVLLVACGPDKTRPSPVVVQPLADAAPEVDHLQAGLDTEASEPARAREHLRAACDAGELEGCRLLGLMLKTGRGGDVDLAAAIPLFERGCDGGVLRACRHFAASLAFGDGIAADPARAYTMTIDLCERGDPGSCFNVGVYLRDAIGTAKDLVAAAASFEQVCLAGDQAGCFDARDVRPAACEGHNYPNACLSLAGLHAEGVGGCANDVGCQAALEEMACNGGVAEACH